MNRRNIHALLADLSPEPTFDLKLENGKKAGRRAFDLDTMPTRRKHRPKPELSTASFSRSRDPVLQEVRNKQRMQWEAKFKVNTETITKPYSFYTQTGVVEPYLPSPLEDSVQTRAEKLCFQKEFTFTGYDIMTDGSCDEQRKSLEALNKQGNLDTYREACRRLGVAPVHVVESCINSPNIELARYGLGPIGTKALAVALVYNYTVRRVCLVDNWIGLVGAVAVSEMLNANQKLTELDISENSIGQEGLLAITNVVSEHRRLQKLNISGTEIADKGSKLIKFILESNICLKELYLARNRLSEQGGVNIAEGLAKNETLQLLDLSWNHIRRQGATAIAKVLQKNQSLTSLDLSWNGFALNGCHELGKSLSKNSTLTDLNLTANRVNSDAVIVLLAGLQRNTGLKKLTLNHNPISPQMATVILRSIANSKVKSLEQLDMEDIVVEKEFINCLRRLNETDPIIVRHGHVIDKSTAIGAESTSLAYLDPRILLFYLMEKEGMRVIDLFNRLDTDGSQSLSRLELKEGLVEASLPFTEDQLDELVNKLDEDGDGEISLGELLNGERMFKRQRLANKGKFKIPKEILEHSRKLSQRKDSIKSTTSTNVDDTSTDKLLSAT